MHEQIAKLLLTHKDLPIVCGGQNIVGVELQEWTQEENEQSGTVLHPRIYLFAADEVHNH